MNKLEIWQDLQQIREQSPLVHNITNYVVMNFTANALLAIGASPVMAHAIDEVADMVAIARSLVINIGTLDKNWIESMSLAMEKANELEKPIVLDPVGAGATAYRTETAQYLCSRYKPSVIRGNASEIKSLVLSGSGITTKGVDSQDLSDTVLAEADYVNKEYQSVVCVSGATDYIIDGNTQIQVKNGQAIMSKVTGMGCTATALIGAFLAVNPSPLRATAHAMAVMGIAGDIAAEKSNGGTGSFQVHFLDALSQMQLEQIEKRVNWLEIED